MSFNAYWELEELAKQKNMDLCKLLVEFRQDLNDMVNSCPIFQLEVSRSGNVFEIFDEKKSKCEPPTLAGLYAIFTPHSLIYYGEATDLYRRLLKDPDNTADSGKKFNNQGRAILKLVLHRQWSETLGITPLFIQLFSEDQSLPKHPGQTFGDVYKVRQFTKSLEGAMGLFINSFHKVQILRAKSIYGSLFIKKE